ncbi:MAG: glycoside hydrolase family 172 protein, partial [Planctomycetota bacterium]
MADRDAVARFPSPGYTALQTSSYDQSSKTPGTESWTANRDYSQFLGSETREGRTEYVMLDATGPGAVVRIWLTWAGRPTIPFSDGTIRLYLDDAEQPIVEAAASQFIDGGGMADGGPFGAAPFAYGVSEETPHDRRGHNLFVPIPFAGRCKITYETKQELDATGRINESFYYHVGYRLYDSGTDVKTFSMDQWDQLKDLRRDVAYRLNSVVALENSRDDPPTVAAANPVIQIAARQAHTIQVANAEGAIREIKLDGSKLSPQQLRSTLVSLEFDGIETIRVPLEGFFTTGYLPSPFQTWMTAVSDSLVMQNHYTMPFRNSATLRLINLSDQAVTIPSIQIQTGNWNWNDSSMHFHAEWNLDRRLKTGVAKTQDDRKGVQDLDFLAATGSGVMVGDSVTLFSGAARWWGEGDEKIWVDGETFPSHFGTGTEDYYGYAWCRPERFSMPLHAQPVGRGALLGGPVVNTRIRSLDAIPFRKSIDFDMEIWHWSDTEVDYARTVFWYGRPGA